GLDEKAADKRIEDLSQQALAVYKLERKKLDNEALLKQGKITEAEAAARMADTQAKYGKDLPQTPEQKAEVEELLTTVRKEAPGKATAKWGILGLVGLNQVLEKIDDSVRSPFMPYGLSGIMLGASIVFFAYIGFDAVSTHSEEARNPQRDVPIGILASLAICTVLYIAVSAVITGMEPYPED